MSKKSKPKTRTKAPADTPRFRPVPNWPLLMLSCAGIALTSYLSWTALTGNAPQGCSAGGGCDVVLTSRWATLLGVPTALWGLFAYSALAAIAFVRRADRQWSYAWTAVVFGVCYSAYLTVVSIAILEAACPYCLTSLGLMIAALALVIAQRPREIGQRSWMRLVATRVAPAAIAILVLHGSYAAPDPELAGPEDPNTRALAEHLTEKGVLFYGASWCPHCQEQKRLFGASASRLPYIECSPGGRNAPAAASCRRAGVVSYPTWVINGRPIVGEVLSLAQLADATAFPGAANFR